MKQSAETSVRGFEERHVAVRSRRVLGNTGLWIELSVPCPLRGHDVPLDDCTRCDRCAGLVVTPDSKNAVVTCRIPAEEDRLEPPASEATREADDDDSPISEIMTTHVICVRADLDVADLGAVFLEMGISGAPVVGEDGKPVGIVSKTDLIRHVCERGTLSRGTACVSDVMMPMAICLPANQSIPRAAALMAFEHVHRVPVVGPSGNVVGIVSSLDVIRWLARRNGYVVSG